MMIYRFLLLASILVAADIAAQTSPDHGMELSLRPAAAQYVLRGRVLQSEGVVQTWLELNYTNVTSDTLPSLIFRMPKPDELVFDSILWLGAPLDSSRVDREENILTLRIPLKPGESAPLMMSFRSQIDGLKRLGAKRATVAYAEDWYPSILAQHNGAWLVGDAGLPPTLEICDFRVELVVDTPLQIVAPGQFANEVEHLGLIPDKVDSIVYDVYAKAGSEDGEATRAAYFVATGCEQFKFALMHDPYLVRIIRGRQTLDLFSAEPRAQSGRTRLVVDAARITEQVITTLGPIPDGRFAVIIDRRQSDLQYRSRLANVSTSSRDPNIVLADLTVSLVGQYFTSCLPDSSNLPWSDGAVIYTTASILHEIYGDNGYDMLAAWIDWRLPPRDPRSFFGPPAFVWMENIRKPNRPWSPKDSLLYEGIVVAPSALQVAAVCAGKDTADRTLIEFSLSTRHRHTLQTEYLQALAEITDPRSRKSLGEWSQRPRVFDWSIEQVKLARNDSGYLLSFEVDAQALPSLPVGVEIVTAGDTLGYTLEPDAERAGHVPVTKQLVYRPESITVDPRHLLPDRNRQNNVYSIQSSLSRNSRNRVEFPTFRRLSRGD